MKAQMKAVVASAVVICMCLCAVSGITYSWWSDSENTEITVTTGGLSVEVFDVSTINTSGGAVAPQFSVKDSSGSDSNGMNYFTA